MNTNNTLNQINTYTMLNALKAFIRFIVQLKGRRRP